MYLKRIELHGFKTFPDLTEVVLSPGVTAVVGPNGCGKSNLMDAVRWVLGEQRPRILRGGKMEEVIFGGTPQRPGVSASEVTLIVDNQSGGLTTDFSEVSITRRLDRAGESEYRLNGVSCRLKDINDLLLDTGMGSHGYAVIQAAMIDAILSENPDERRFLFEEAAGVSKYKVRQKAAMRKLEATEQDLLRLTDLKNEVATHVRSLARQKGMAERHRQLRDKWKAIDLVLALREYQRRLGQSTALQSEHQKAREEALTLSAQVDKIELEWQSLRLSLDEAERTAQSAADRLTESTNALHAHSTESIRWADRRKHLEEDRTRISERDKSLAGRLTELADRRLRSEYEAGNAQAAGELIADRIAKVEIAYREAQKTTTDRADTLRAIQAEYAQVERDHLRAVSQREALVQRREDARLRHQALRERGDKQAILLDDAMIEVSRLTRDTRIAEAESAAVDCERLVRLISEHAPGQRVRIDDLTARLRGLGSLLASLRQNLEAATKRLQEYQHRAEALGIEWTQEELPDLDTQIDAGSAAETELKLRVTALEGQLETAQKALAEAEVSQNQAATTLNQARVEVVEAQAKLDAHRSEIRRFDETTHEIQLEEESLEARLTEIRAELEALAQNIATAADRERELRAACDREEAARSAARSEVARQKDGISGHETRLRELRHTRDAAEHKRTQIEIELSTLRNDAEQTRRRIHETHGVDAASTQIEQRAETDDELREKSESLKQQIDRLGPVNPLALEEYQQEKQRSDFLEKQVGDLHAAKTQLQETIAELNRTAGERFLETFNTARTHFQEVFTELFRGGEADVRLTEEGNPLESPIEIYARPRGKKFIGIRQLSGGERALTALALLFGLYLVKPSPFCIFDEVDAPLDDANCGRFLRLIDRFKGRTQFIIVTHNKLTMEAADALYGVTMEQPGISKLVSVRLNRAGESTGEPGLAEPRIAIANGVDASTTVEP